MDEIMAEKYKAPEETWLGKKDGSSTRYCITYIFSPPTMSLLGLCSEESAWLIYSGVQAAGELLQALLLFVHRWSGE